MDDGCDGPGTYTDNIRQCGAMRGSKSFKDPMTHECQPCSRKFDASVAWPVYSVINCIQIL